MLNMLRLLNHRGGGALLRDYYQVNKNLYLSEVIYIVGTGGQSLKGDLTYETPPLVMASVISNTHFNHETPHVTQTNIGIRHKRMYACLPRYVNKNC